MSEYTSIERIPYPPEELRILADLTLELVKLRQNECKQLCVENVGPEIWGRLLGATYPPPPIVSGSYSAFMTSFVTELDDYRPHINERQRCVDCGHEQLSTHAADVKREWWECGNCGEMSARASGNG